MAIGMLTTRRTHAAIVRFSLSCTPRALHAQLDTCFEWSNMEDKNRATACLQAVPSRENCRAAESQASGYRRRES
jgi:hypothetical protein